MRFEYIEKDPFYELDEWKIIEKKFDLKNNGNDESVFTTANGYIGVRGLFEEGLEDSQAMPDVMLNGVYEYYWEVPIPFRPGFTGYHHKITKQINPLNIKVFVDGELAKLTDKNFSRTLDFLNGVVTREYDFVTKSNKTVTIRYERFASQYDRNILCSRTSVIAKDDVNVVLQTMLNNKLGYEQSNDDEFNKIYSGIKFENNNGLLIAEYTTKESKYTTTVAIKESANSLKHTQKVNAKGAASKYNGKLKKGETFIYERIIGFGCSKDLENQHSYIVNLINNAKSFDEYLQLNAENLKEFWDISNIEIDKDVLVTQGVRFSMLQVYQSAGRDGLTNISANGLSGVVYQGHTFWDTEMYMQPLFTYGKQDLSRKLLEYRYSILDNARERAKQMDDQGALYAWCSINGQECSIYHEASTAQYHLNADIGYAIMSYYEASNDEDFIVKMGAEILFEITKCLAHRGSFIEDKDNKFCINVICGPDEYNPIVDNNLYTNLLTKKVFEFTLKMKDLLKAKHPEKLAQLIDKCGMNDNEFDLIKRASENMYIPYNKKHEIYMQDDNFMYKDPIKIDDIPANKVPLLGNLHPLNLWRYQVCKQADIVLATFIMSDFFTKKEIEKIYDYYEPKTMHDSSLSAAIHSIVACSIGRQQIAYKYLKQSSRMDLDNVNGNTRYGLHAACMGGARMLIVNGYAGLRVYNDMLHFEPSIYEKWTKYSFKTSFKGCVLKTLIAKEGTTYNLEKGDELIISHFGKEIKVTSQPVFIKN